MSLKHEPCIDTCNRLLRGERSAMETYGQALEKYRANPVIAAELTRIRDEHAAAVSALEQNVRSMGGTPDLDSGAWGAFAGIVQSAANLFGAGSALEALQNGERAGLGDYEAALEDDDVMADCKDMMRRSLIPPTREHIETLGRLQTAA